MGCNCKATDYVRKTKKFYGYDSETKEKVPIKEKIKMVLRAIFMWIILIVTFPFFILFFIFIKPFLNNKMMTFFGSLKIRI
jgi:lipopolysaccharide/colanic/teichoic acid biosynthesis glycosyltransferase